MNSTLDYGPARVSVFHRTSGGKDPSERWCIISVNADSDSQGLDTSSAVRYIPNFCVASRQIWQASVKLHYDASHFISNYFNYFHHVSLQLLLCHDNATNVGSDIKTEEETNRACLIAINPTTNLKDAQWQDKNLALIINYKLHGKEKPDVCK